MKTMMDVYEQLSDTLFELAKQCGNIWQEAVDSGDTLTGVSGALYGQYMVLDAARRELQAQQEKIRRELWAEASAAEKVLEREYSDVAEVFLAGGCDRDSKEYEVVKIAAERLHKNRAQLRALVVFR